MNFATNFDPAFSSAEFRGRKRATTLIESSAGGSFGMSSATEELREIVEEEIPPLDIVPTLDFTHTGKNWKVKRVLLQEWSLAGHRIWIPKLVICDAPPSN